MCELLGFSSAKEHNVSRYLKVLSNHSENHPHGWGAAFRQHGDIKTIKESVRADKSQFLKSIIDGGMVTDLLIGHIRLATIGNMEYNNCHPFLSNDCSGAPWILFHNGTMFNTELTKDYTAIQEGATDSECILLYLMDAMNAAIAESGHLTTLQPFNLLSECVTKLSRGNKLNLMIFYKETLFVHTNMAKTLFYREIEDSVIFATVPLDNMEWKPVPMMKLLGYKKGRLIFEGKSPSFEYQAPAN